MIDSAKGAINDPENFATVTKSKVKDTEGAMLTLANLTAALKRWENFAVHPELAAEARTWDGKSRVTVEADALPPAIEPPAYSMNITLETAETLDSLQAMAEGKDIVIHNAEYGDFAFEWGRMGREKDGKGGMGLLHMIYQRVLNGFSVQEAARTAVLASIAAQEGTLAEVRMNKHLFEKYGVRAVVAYNSSTERKVITGFVIASIKQPKLAVDDGAANMSRQLYAQTTLNRRDVVGAAMKDAIAWYEDIVKMYPQDYDRVLSGYVVSLKLKQEAKVRKWGESSPESTVSYSIIGPHAQTWSRYADKVFSGRDDGMERVEIDASQSALRQAKDGQNILRYYYERVKTPRPERKGKYLAPLGHILQFPELYEAYPWLKNTYVHGYNDTDDLAQGIAYPGELPGSISLNFAHLAQEIPFEGIVVDERACRSILLHEVQHLIQAEEGYESGGDREYVRSILPDSELSDLELYLRAAGEIESRNVESRMLMSRQHREAVPFNQTLEFPGAAINTDRLNPGYAMHLTSADVCRTRQEARAKAARRGKPLRLVNRFLDLSAVFNARSEGKFAQEDSRGRTEKNLVAMGFGVDEANTVHWSAFGNIEALFANGERMKLERAYKKRESRKGFLHVYSPFEVEGFPGEFEADIELLLHREKGHEPTACLMSVSIRKKPLENYRRGGMPVPSSSQAVEDIQSVFPEIVKAQTEEAGYAMRWLGGKQVREALAPERGSLALSSLIDNMVLYMNKAGELGDTLRLDDDNEREQYINTVHDVTGKLLLLTMALPEKWRPSIDRDLKYLRKYMELAMRGEVDLAAESDWDTWKIIQSEFGRDAKGAEQWLQELGRDKAHKQVEKILGRIKNKMEKWGKSQVRQQIQRLVKMATPQIDLVTKRSKRGLMDADSARRVMEVESALNMKENDWIAGMMEYGDLMSDNEVAASKANFLQVFGCFERMSLSEATHALDELKKYVRDARTSWDEALDKKRADRVRMNRKIVEALGRPDVATVKKNDNLPSAWKNAAGIPADMMNVLQLFPVISKKGLGFWVDGLRTRILDAEHAMHRATVHRMHELSKLAARLKYKSYDEFLNELHGDPVQVPGLHAVQSMDAAFDRAGREAKLRRRISRSLFCG